MRSLLAILMMSVLTFSVHAQKTFIQCGQLIDVKQLQVLKEKTIIIEGNKIIDVVSCLLYTSPSPRD